MNRISGFICQLSRELMSRQVFTMQIQSCSQANWFAQVGFCIHVEEKGGQNNESPPGEEIRWASLQDPKPGGGCFGPIRLLGGGESLNSQKLCAFA